MSTSELKRKREDEEGSEEKPAKAQKTEASQSAPDAAATSKTPILHLEVKLEGSTFELELEFSAQKSFADLATTIIKEAGFRFLPIYSFHLDGEPFGTSKGVYYGELTNKEPLAKDKTVKSGLDKDKVESFLFLYDYSECHNFIITVKKTDNDSEHGAEHVKVVSVKGQAPHSGEEPEDDFDDISDEEDEDEEYEDEEEEEEDSD